MIEKDRFLTPGVKLVIKRMEELGFRCDVVGGAVRNYLLGLDVSDYDITTDATPDEVEAAFSDLRVIKTGIKHGTLTVIALGESLEITTYRVDGGYLDHRHPDSVSFTKSLESDLERRDFTVNALCYNPKYGITDLFGGCDDLKNGIIRAVGEPRLRFEEDALRILRALRFASVLDFEIEKETAAAVRECRGLLSAPSRERISAEWKKLLSGVGSYRIIEEYRDVIAVFIPEIADGAMPDAECWRDASYMARFTSLFAGLKNPGEIFSSVAKRLRFDNNTACLGRTMLEYCFDNRAKSLTGQRLMLSEISDDQLASVLELRRLLTLGDPDEKIYMKQIIDGGLVCRLSGLAIGGRELGAMGIRGEAVGKTLSLLLRAVILDECENTPDALVALASKIGSNS